MIASSQSVETSVSGERQYRTNQERSKSYAEVGAKNSTAENKTTAFERSAMPSIRNQKLAREVQIHRREKVQHGRKEQDSKGTRSRNKGSTPERRPDFSSTLRVPFFGLRLQFCLKVDTYTRSIGKGAFIESK